MGILLFLIPLPLLAGPALPPLVSSGESISDFPSWMIDNKTVYTSIDFSPDGNALISGSYDATVKLWDIHSRRLLQTFKGHKHPVWSVSFSPDGKILASGSNDSTIKLWSAQSGRLLHTLEGHQGDVYSVSFSPNGNIIASGSHDNTIKLWDIQSKQLLHTLKGHQGSVYSVSFSPDGKILASGSDDNTIKLWDTHGRRLLDTFEGHPGSVYSVRFSPDGKTLASSDSRDVINLWDIIERRLLYTFEQPSLGTPSVSFSPDSKTLAFASWTNKIGLWDIVGQRLLHTFETFEESYTGITSVRFSPDGKTLASASWANKIQLWDTNNRKLIHSLEGHSNAISALNFSPDGKTLISGSDDTTIKLWNTTNQNLLHTFKGHSNSVSSIKFSPDGKTFISASGDATVKLWDTTSRELLHTIEKPQSRTFTSSSGSLFEGKSRILSSIDYSFDGKTFASASGGTKIKLWDTISQNLRHTFNKEHSGIVYSVSFSPDDKTLASGHADGTIKLWDTHDGRLIYTFDGYNGTNNEGHQGTAKSLDFSPNGKILASGAFDGTVRLWDVHNRRLIHTFMKQELVYSVSFSLDGKILASGSDNTVKLWDTTEQRLLHIFEGHSGTVFSISFSPDDKTLASGSSDGTIKLWDIETKKLIYTLIGGANDNWLSHNNKTFQRGDDGSLLLERIGKDWQPALPKNFAKNKVESPTLTLLDNTPIALHSGDTQDLSFEVTNTGQQTLYWPTIELAEDSPFTRHSFTGEAPNTIEPGKTVRLHTKIGAHLNDIIQPEQRILKLRLVAPQQTASDWLEIPVKVETPKLELTETSLVKGENTLKVRIENTGSQAIENTFFNLTIPGLPKQDIQNSQNSIEPDGFTERFFSVPEDFNPPKDLKINLDVRNAALPFMVWNFDAPVTLPKPPIWMYAGLALLTMLSAFGVFYFRRYRHPLLVSLSDEPQSLLKLPQEQLPEAQQRLQQTKRLETVLSDASVSPKTLKQALIFQQQNPEEKATYIAQRIGGTMENMPPLALRERGPGGEGEQRAILKTPEGFPLNIDKLLLCFPEAEEAPEDVFQTLKTNPSTQNRITLIIGPDSAYQRKLYNTTKQLDNKWVAPQSSELTRLLLSPNPENALAEILSGQLSLQQISPYRVGGGVSNESVFFGRRELIAQITNRDPANYLMVGGRQVGKSTLLKALERRYADNPQIQCHYLALSNEVLVPRLAALLKLDKTSDPEALASQLDERIQQDGQRYIFLIDEADRFIEHEKARDYPILNVFRRLSEEGNCVFILAGFWQLYQHAVLDYQSPIRNFGELLSVGALEKPACIELVTEPMRSMNLLWDNQTLVEQLVEACGQRANLIAIACQHIVRNLPPQQRNITAGDMHKALDSDEIRRALTGWVVGISEAEQTYERMVVYATIEQQDFSTAELLDMAQQQNLQLDTQQLEKTLSRLELAFILGRKEGRWFYRVPLFVDYIKEDAPAAKLETEINRLSSGST